MSAHTIGGLVSVTVHCLRWPDRLRIMWAAILGKPIMFTTDEATIELVTEGSENGS